MDDICFDKCMRCDAVIVSDATAVAALKADNEKLRAVLRTISLMDKVHEHDLFSATCAARAALQQEKSHDQ